MSRYRVWLSADQRRWVIFDMKHFGYCTLPDADDPSTLLPLEWRHASQAEAWLQECYRIWWGWEKEGGGTPPDDWRPLKPELSPFDSGYRDLS